MRLFPHEVDRSAFRHGVTCLINFDVFKRIVVFRGWTPSLAATVGIRSLDFIVVSIPLLD